MPAVDRPKNSIEAHMDMQSKARALRKYIDGLEPEKLEPKHTLEMARMQLDLTAAITELMGCISREARKDYSSVDHTHNARVELRPYEINRAGV